MACHGEKGEGNREVGAPRLNDNIWLYGGDKKTLVETVTYARAGVMPAWVVAWTRSPSSNSRSTSIPWAAARSKNSDFTGRH